MSLPNDGKQDLRSCWTGTSDPMNYGRGEQRNSRVVIDACKPWHRRETFPLAVGSSAELDGASTRSGRTSCRHRQVQEPSTLFVLTSERC